MPSSRAEQWTYGHYVHCCGPGEGMLTGETLRNLPLTHFWYWSQATVYLIHPNTSYHFFGGTGAVHAGGTGAWAATITSALTSAAVLFTTATERRAEWAPHGVPGAGQPTENAGQYPWGKGLAGTVLTAVFPMSEVPGSRYGVASPPRGSSWLIMKIAPVGSVRVALRP